MKNMKLLLVIAGVAFVVSGCGTTVVNKSTLDTLEADKAALQAQIVELQKQLAVCQIQSEKASLSGQIAELQRQLEVAKPDT